MTVSPIQRQVITLTAQRCYIFRLGESQRNRDFLADSLAGCGSMVQFIEQVMAFVLPDLTF